MNGHFSLLTHQPSQSMMICFVNQLTKLLISNLVHVKSLPQIPSVVMENHIWNKSSVYQNTTGEIHAVVKLLTQGWYFEPWNPSDSQSCETIRGQPLNGGIPVFYSPNISNFKYASIFYLFRRKSRIRSSGNPYYDQFCHICHIFTL